MAEIVARMRKRIEELLDDLRELELKLREGRTQVSEGSELSDLEKKVYDAIRRADEKGFSLPIPRICHETGLSRREVGAAVESLQQRGLIWSYRIEWGAYDYPVYQARKSPLPALCAGVDEEMFGKLKERVEDFLLKRKRFTLSELNREVMDIREEYGVGKQIFNSCVRRILIAKMKGGELKASRENGKIYYQPA